MKLVAVIGSPRGMKGNTGMLLDAVVQGARDAGAEVEVLSLAALTVDPCTSCEVCHMTGDCSIHDDFDRILTAMLAADGLILASPNYIINVSAQMKALLDRLSGPIHTQAFTNKYAAAVVTSGSSNGDEVAHYLLRAARLTGYFTVGSVDALGWQMMRDETRAPFTAAAIALGHELVEAIRARRIYPDQEAEITQMRERMQQLTRMRKDDWQYEYEYWKAKQGE